MNRYTIFATVTFGLESVVSGELAALGYQGVLVENGRAVLSGTDEDIARLNLWLRSADRVLIRLAEFPARDLDDVYEGMRSITWADFLPKNPRIIVTARAARREGERRLTRRGASQSRTGASRPAFGVPSLQSVGKKAVMDGLVSARGAGRASGGAGKGGEGRARGGAGKTWADAGKVRGGPGKAAAGGVARIEETGPLYPVSISVSASGVATVTLDTSGGGLHRRGYRTEAGEAPIRETLAAGMVLLSRWDPSRPFADPLCGSGTIPIEAALIGANAAPGIRRGFAAEVWPHIPGSIFPRAREEAAGLLKRAPMDIRGSDRDAGLVAVAARNAERAGVGVGFSRVDLKDLRLDGEYGCIVTNPPYAERLGEEEETAGLYASLGRLFKSLPTWSLFALSAHPRFATLFGASPTKNRKLYNGNIRCYYHEYFGPLPR